MSGDDSMALRVAIEECRVRLDLFLDPLNIYLRFQACHFALRQFWALAARE